MKNPILIFDFDGTIADTHHMLCQISNRLSKQYDYNKIDFNELSMLKDLSAREIIKHLEVPILKIPSIISHAKREFQKDLEKLNPIKDIKEILFQLKEKVENIGILSSNSQENVDGFLSNHNMNIFDFIHTTSKVWSKNISLKKLIKKYGFDKKDIIYIGDEIRDIAAARKLGIKVASVCWGYNSKKALARLKPDYILNTPKDLLQLCDSLT